jgi:hypothetical protein
MEIWTPELGHDHECILDMCGINPQRPGAHHVVVLSAWWRVALGAGGKWRLLTSALPAADGRLERYVCAM